MKAFRRITTLAICGVLLGSTMSIMGAAPATARFSSCDQKIASMEKWAAKQYDHGKLSTEEYENIQAEIAAHRQIWGC